MGPFSKTCHFSNIRVFLFFEQAVRTFLPIFEPKLPFCKRTTLMPNIRCLLEPFFAQNNSNNWLKRYVFRKYLFLPILIFEPRPIFFAKAIAFA